MEKYTVKLNRKYVIATLSSPTQYLLSKHWGKWAFTDNIEMATKTKTVNVAEMVKCNYYHDFGMDVDLIILPIEVEYRVVNECDNNGIQIDT